MMLDFGYLIVIAIGMVILWWPAGTYHQWSWLWVAVLALVLGWEVWSRFFTPDKETISGVMRKYRKQHPVRFWLMLTLWILFGWALAVHLAT